MEEKKYKILCVDDEESVLRSLARTLRLAGYETVLANSVAKALELLEENEVDLIISDQRMPQMTGVDFFAIVKNKFPKPSRIMLSGYSDFESLVNAVNKGEIYRYFSKPWNTEELLESIKLALEEE